MRRGVSSRMRRKQRFTLVLKLGQRRLIFQYLQRNENSCLILELSMHMLSERDLSSQELETVRRSRNPTVAVHDQWRSANKRGSASICSRSWLLRDCAIARRYACSSVAWKILRRTRIFVWVGHRSKTTVDQTGENYLHNGEFRTSGCSRVVIQFWCKVVFNIATRTRQVHLHVHLQVQH